MLLWSGIVADAGFLLLFLVDCSLGSWVAGRAQAVNLDEMQMLNCSVQRCLFIVSKFAVASNGSAHQGGGSDVQSMEGSIHELGCLAYHPWLPVWERS